MSILLPSTFGLPPAASVIMLAGIYYGAMYGGSTTSILVNIPGEAASVITCLDGYQMARRGRAGPALGISALGSFIGGTFSIIALMFLVFPLADAALKFGPPEFFALMFLGMTILTYLARGSVLNAFLMVLLGLILGTVGMDPISGMPRFHFGLASLLDGVGLVPVAMGLFGVAEVLTGLESLIPRSILQTKIKNLLPNRQDWKESAGPIARGSFVGFLCGILPGAGAVMSTFLSYTIEKKLSKHPEEFGKGAIAGVAGPETANNAAAGGAFVPMLALGIPPNPIMGILLGSLMIHGVSAGPLLDYPASRHILGGHRKHVCGEHHAGASQPSPHWHVGKSTEGPSQDPSAFDSPLLPHRFLRGKQQLCRRNHHGFFRCCWIYIEKTRL